MIDAEHAGLYFLSFINFLEPNFLTPVIKLKSSFPHDFLNSILTQEPDFSWSELQ